ncbi:MAG TPA: hypothetical protein VFN24_10295 [Microbacterium sp.]|nr:hypothetical protein [Microbacterium sp.]
MKKLGKLAVVGSVVGTLCVGFVGGGAIAGSFLAGPADPSFHSGAPAPSYEENDAGYTYGSALDAISPETEPDLILVLATNGVEGYVFKTELDNASGALDFKSPEEAVAWQERNQDDVVLAVYAKDGKTRIGEFVIARGYTAAR